MRNSTAHIWIVVALWIASSLSCNQRKASESNHTENEPLKTQLFTLLKPEDTNVDFLNHVEENKKNYVVHFNYVYNGGGVAVGDINNDGLTDIYFTGNEVSNKLYLNKGNFEFLDITKKSGVGGGDGWHSGVNMVDINADGFLDIYICRGGWHDTDDQRKNLLFVNNGDLTFTEKGQEFGLDEKGYSIQSTFFDMDNDGDLDVYITNRPSLFYLTPKEVTQGEKAENDLERDKLYLNEDGKFKEIGKQAGIRNNFGYGLGVVATDVNNDGFTDLYVTNDYEQQDYLYLNQGNNTFKESIKNTTNHTTFYSMGVDVVDFNNDGFEDILALDMLPADYVRSKTTMASMNVEKYQELLDRGYHYQYMHNALHLNLGNGFFSEIGQLAGIAKTDWSWACLGSDFDNDGYRDIFVSNGYRRDVTDKDATRKFYRYINNNAINQNTEEQNIKNILSLYNSTKLTNYAFRNNGDLTFGSVASEWGLDEKSFSNGAVTADLDNDGDLDLVVNNLEDQAFVYRNNAESLGRNFLKVKLAGPEANKFGIGAKITIKYDDQIQYHEFKTTRGYLSSVEPIAHFGLGEVKHIEEVTALWADGSVSTLKDIQANQMVNIKYEFATKRTSGELTYDPLFTNASEDFFSEEILHQENEFDDYHDQILLPHKMSTLGPFVEVADVNADGLEDFYVGGASGQAGKVFLQDSDGGFKRQNRDIFKVDKKHEDMGAAFFDCDGDGDLDLYVVSGGSEEDAKSGYYQDRLYINDGQGQFVKSPGLPDIEVSGSIVLPHDFDQDGDIDLFVGGRQVPGQYPKPAASLLLQNVGGKFEEVTEQYSREFRTLGMVTSGQWSDIDNDGNKELIVVGEWMPVTIFRHVDGKFQNVSKEYGLSLTRGWWNKVLADDIDNDGDTDFVIGNLGENYKFSASKEKPFYVFADDFDGNGTNDIFLAKANNKQLVPIRGKECSSQQLPSLKQKFKSYESFAKSDIYGILGEKISEALRYEAHIFSSIVLENEGNSFKIKRLPTEAQFSCINGIFCKDLNQDGIKDLVIAGNNFEVEIETTRADASPGLVLLGKGNIEYQALKPLESGFFIPDNVKDLKAINLRDGNPAVLVTVNNGKLRLFNQASAGKEKLLASH